MECWLTIATTVVVTLLVGGCDRQGVAGGDVAGGDATAGDATAEDVTVMVVADAETFSADGPPPTAGADSRSADVAVTSADHERLHPGFDPQAPCTCAAATRSGGWCWRCNVGHVAGLRITSAALFEALDPHGHQLDNKCLQLQACRDAIRDDGFCAAVGFGFVGGKAYFTRLTFGLAKGKPVEPSDLQCGQCRRAVEHGGWCEVCRMGLVGNTALNDHDLYQQTAREFHRLKQAIARAPVCEQCATAMVFHSLCALCRMSYESETPERISFDGS